MRRCLDVEITTPVPGLATGFRYLILGDECRRPYGFGFTGEPTGRPPLPDETADARRGVGVERHARTWTDADRARARELQAAGMSWAQVAEHDRRFKSTVQGWLR